MNAPQTYLNVPRPYRFNVDEFILLNDAGVFDDCGKTELIEGEIYYMNSQWSRHARAKSNLNTEIALALRAMASEYEAIVEVAVHLSDDSMPEPDIVVTNYKGNRAVPLDTVALLVEVSDTTLGTDLGRKRELYAKAGVPEYWVVDVNDNRVLIHADPKDGTYPEPHSIPFGEKLISRTFARLEVESNRLV